MKHRLFILALLLSAGCADAPDDTPSAPATSPRDESCIPGMFRVKLRDADADLDTRAFTRSGGSGCPGFDAAATRAGAYSIRRVFSDGERFRERRRKAGLHRWYDVLVDPELSVGEAMARFGHPDEVVCIEPVYRMVPTAAKPVVRAAAVPDLSVAPFNDPLQDNQWFLCNDGTLSGQREGADLNVRPAWSVTAGSHEVIVAVADGGIDWTHPDLAANMWDDGEGHCGYNFNRRNYEITPSDHGTHVAGIIGAVNNNGVGICGIAGGDGSPESGVRLMCCQVFDDVGSASIEELMTWSADHGAVISQNSWNYVGVSDLSQSGKEAIDYFIEHAGCDEQGNQIGPMKGGIVIFAAGNDGVATPQYPAAYEPVVAVASLGADLRKASSSNYGDWIDIAALGGDANNGDERYGVYSTIPDGHYGFASGTSMACPQVSGIAALAVAEFGGPGFTSDRLKELLLGSGRRQLVENYNPEYVGQLGSGLVDAEYLFFRDAVPEPVREAAATGGGTRLTLQWTVPADYLGRAVTSYDLRVVSAESGKTLREEAVEIPDAEVGGTGTHTIEGLDPQTGYRVSIISKSRYGTPAEPFELAAATSENTPPSANGPLPALFLAGSDRNGIALDLDEWFSDPDAPKDQLSYFVSFPSASVVEGRISGSELRLQPVATGISTLTVIAQDRYGGSASAPLRVTVDGTGAAVELFPNPCTERLNLRIPGATGSFPVRICDRTGRDLLNVTVSIRENEDGNTGWMNVADLVPGVYTCKVDYYGKTFDIPFIKR